jgi:hypothetical protein
VDKIAIINEQIRELKLWKMSSEPPIEDLQVILQALVWVKRKTPRPKGSYLRLLPQEEGKEDGFEDTASQHYGGFFVLVRRHRDKFPQVS